jgi:hypothetical protein
MVQAEPQADQAFAGTQRRSASGSHSFYRKVWHTDHPAFKVDPVPEDLPLHDVLTIASIASRPKRPVARRRKVEGSGTTFTTFNLNWSNRIVPGGDPSGGNSSTPYE